MSDILAKLLATENITVHKSNTAETGSFDLKARVLTLPVWKEFDKDVVDLMTGHEVGHALWTPEKEWEDAIKEEGVNKDILNIVEDPRVDRKIKNKYPGLRRSYYNGYIVLVQQGFFGPIEKFRSMSLLDRLNLYFKCGADSVSFKSDELWAVDAVEGTQTFADVVEVSKQLQMHWANDDPDQSALASGSSTSSEGLSFGNNDESDARSLDDSKKSSEGFDGLEQHNAEGFVSETQQAFEERANELLEEDPGNSRHYFTLPKPIINRMVIPSRKILTDLRVNYKTNWITKLVEYNRSQDEIDMRQTYMDFRNGSTKIINYMVKEFERRKSADEYKRTSVARTGVINVNKLHSYKYAEDIFLKRAIVSDGKNHGMIILVDWSASMWSNLAATMQQLMSLVWFCNKVNIPWEVYAFTNGWFGSLEEEISLADKEKFIRDREAGVWKYKEGDAYFGRKTGFRLLNLLSSRMSAPDLNEMMYYLWLGSHEPESIFTGKYSLNSTPTVEAMCAMQEILPNFKEHYKLHKVNFICLTDGEPNSQITEFYTEHNENTDYEGRLPSRRSNLYLHDPITGKEYSVWQKGQPSRAVYRQAPAQANMFTKMLHDRYQVRTIGIYLIPGTRVDRYTLERYFGWYSYYKAEHQRARKEIREFGFCTVKNAGFEEYYIMPTGRFRIQNDTTLAGEPGSLSDLSKGKLKTLFAANQKQKFGNRMLANRMMNLLV